MTFAPRPLRDLSPDSSRAMETYSVVTLTNGESATVQGSPESLMGAFLNPPRHVEGPVFFRFECRPDDAGQLDESEGRPWHVRTDYIASIAPA